MMMMVAVEGKKVTKFRFKVMDVFISFDKID